MNIDFAGEIFYWRGPAPFLFVAVPEAISQTIRAVAAELTYGWGVVPTQVQLGNTQWNTALFPKNGLYLVPIRQSVQKAEHVGVGDTVTLRLQLG